MNLTRDLIIALPLKDADPSLLTHWLLTWAESYSENEQAMVTEALQMASYFHRNQTRTNRGNLPRDNYVTHPLRNAVRLIRYGVTDHEVIIAAILHDLVEDAAEEMVSAYRGKVLQGATVNRELALEIIEGKFGGMVSHYVDMVSNRIFVQPMTKAARVEAYLSHLEIVLNSPEIFLVKFSDWVDNGAGLHHNNVAGNEGMIRHLSDKYLRLGRILQDKLNNHEFIVKLRTVPGLDSLDPLEQHLEDGLDSLEKLRSV